MSVKNAEKITELNHPAGQLSNLGRLTMGGENLASSDEKIAAGIKRQRWRRLFLRREWKRC